MILIFFFWLWKSTRVCLGPVGNARKSVPPFSDLNAGLKALSLDENAPDGRGETKPGLATV